MPTNSFDETHAVDYLEKERIELAKLRAAKTGSSVLTPRFILPFNETMNISDTLPAPTSNTPGTFDVVNNKTNLIAYLPMDLDVLDASNSNNGTVTGTETYVDGPLFAVTPNVGIKTRKAFDFDGSSYITLANESNFDFDISNAFSLNCWVKFSASGFNSIITKSFGVSTGFFFFKTGGNKIGCNLLTSTPQTNQITGATTISNNIWYNIVFTFSGNSNRSGMKIYVNGTLDVTGTAQAMTGSILNNNSLTLGAESDGTDLMTGQLDDVQIWNVELSSSDVTDLYAGKQINKDSAATNPAILGLSDIT